MKKKLVIIGGATASGKTSISIELAKKINGEIISADSMQVYKGLDIGTAKITKDEMQGINHFLIDEFEPDEDFNIVVFKNKADEYINEIYARNHIPMVVGGTGFYIHALAYDTKFNEEESSELRKELEKEYDNLGADYMYQKLVLLDEESAKIIHKNNKKRLIRALEYVLATGEKISTHNSKQRKKESPYELYFYVLNMNRELLYKRIDLRVDKMINAGLIDEVKGLLDKGYNKELVSMQGLGYKEIISYLNNEISLEEAIYILKRDTRHFAKRQLTWFRREKDCKWIDMDKFSNVDEIVEYIKEDISSSNQLNIKTK